MSEKTQPAKLFSNGRGTCAGTIFSGAILGRTHTFQYENHDIKISLPVIQFADDSNEPSGENAHLVNFRSGWVDRNSPERSFYSVEYLDIEIAIDGTQEIPNSTLAHRAVQIPESKTGETAKLDEIAEKYQSMLVSVWRHWIRMTRWATNQYQVGLNDIEIGDGGEISYPRICERETRYAVWASPVVFRVLRSAEIDLPRWDHIQTVLNTGHLPPIWFEYLVEAHSRFERSDFSGCLLSCAIACETITRAAFRRLAGTPLNETAGELIDRTAAQAILGNWKKLTGIKADGAVHALFDQRNKLVHSGHIDGIDRQNAALAMKTAISFVEEADKWWFDEIGEPNLRTAICFSE